MRVLSERTRNKKQRRREEDKSNRWDQEVFQKLLVSTEVRMERFSWQLGTQENHKVTVHNERRGKNAWAGNSRGLNRAYIYKGLI